MQGESKMLWARMVAYVTGTVNQELLLRNEYLGAENRILRGQIKGRLLLSEGEKATLAEIAQRLGRKPWKNWRLSRSRIRCWPGTESSSPTSSTDREFANESVGRPRIDEEAERVGRADGERKSRVGLRSYRGALANLGFLLSDQTVGNILRRHGLSPAPKRKQAICWKDFIRSHMEVLVGTDFFTAEVLTLKAEWPAPIAGGQPSKNRT
jgi:putative transposase